MYTENELTATLPLVRVPFHGFDFDILISVLKNDKKWKKGEMNSMILIRDSSRIVLLVILHENTEIKSDLIQKQIVFDIIEGKLEVHSPKNEDHNLSNGETITLNDSKFRINSIKETAFLMTLNS